MKLYEALIKARLVGWLESKDFISPVQAAYRKNRSTCDHILVIQELFLEYRLNKCGPRGGKGPKPHYLRFLDFKKAFDTVSRELLPFKKLNSLGILGKMLRVIRDLYTNNPARVQVQNFLYPEFIVNRGVLQCSKLGPVLFNIFINNLPKKLNDSSLGAQLGDLTISTPGFADDIVLVADCPHHLKLLLLKCQKCATQNKMAFNLKK